MKIVVQQILIETTVNEDHMLIKILFLHSKEKLKMHIVDMISDNRTKS